MDLSVGEILQATGTHVTGFGATQPDTAIVIAGKREREILEEGLTVNLQDTSTLRDFETRAYLEPGAVLHLVLSGRVEFSTGSLSQALSRSEQESAQICFCASSERYEFTRRARAGDQLKKVSVAIKWDWFKRNGIDREVLTQGQTQVLSSWVASPTVMAQAETLFETVSATAPPRNLITLQKKALAFLLVQDLYEHMRADNALSPDHRDRLSRMVSFASHPGTLPSLAEIASVGGMSISSMHRLFARAYGKSTHVHLRETRLQQSADALSAGASVAQAAYVAGYASPSAFATAFRKLMHVAPSQYASRHNRAT